jgi:hypothetical protein
MASYQLDWWMKITGAPPCIILGTSENLISIASAYEKLKARGRKQESCITLQYTFKIKIICTTYLIYAIEIFVLILKRINTSYNPQLTIPILLY